MKIITLPVAAGRVNTAARVLAAFLARMYSEAKGGEFDAAAACRMLMLANVDLGTYTTRDGDALLNELLNHARRLELERERTAAARVERTKGGAA